jgi:NAD+ diphosphatase
MVFIPATQPARLASATYYIPVSNGQLLCQADGSWRQLSQAEFAATGLAINSQHFMGYFNQVACWAVDVERSVEITHAAQWLGLRSQLGLLSEEQFLLAGRALQVVQWHLDHQFCGRCGTPTVSNDDERAKICHRCDLRFYPRLSPCVIVLITRGDECLLAHHARSKNKIYTALAGFVEAGETLEETIHREILEEVGICVQSPRYFLSQPWPFPNQLMLGFHVEYASGEIEADGEEILDARWWRYDQLPQVPPIATLAGQLIAHFVKQQTIRR